MTMMSSLKALLFASPANGAMTGTGAAAPVSGEGGDFAALLGSVAQPVATGDALPVPVPVPVPVPMSGPAGPVPTEGEAPSLPSPLPVDDIAQPVAPVAMQPVTQPEAMPPAALPFVIAPAEIAETPRPTLAEGDAPVRADRPLPQIPVADPATITDAEVEAAPVETGDEADEAAVETSDATPVATLPPAMTAALVPVAPPAAPAASPVAPTPEQVAVPKSTVGGTDKTVPAAPRLPSRGAMAATSTPTPAPSVKDGPLSASGVTTPARPVVAPPSPSIDDAPPKTALEAASSAPLQETAGTANDILLVSMPTPDAGSPDQQAVTVPSRGRGQASSVPPGETPDTVSDTPPISRPLPDAPASTRHAAAAPSQERGQASSVSIEPVRAPPAGMTPPVAPATPAPQAPPATVVAFAAAPSVRANKSAPDMAVETATQPIVAPVQPAPVRSEALSLLQLVRDHFIRRDSAEKAPQVTTSSTNDPIVADIPDATPSAPIPAALAASAPAMIASPIATSLAPVDLGGTLASQVVDMGVQGQWIDGLARDIAGLSAGGARGRFQVSSEHLGQVQVEIRPGATGTTVSLTVASDAARQALQADGDRLIADAALSAVRITDLRVERGPVSEAHRADTAGQQQSGSNGQSQAQNLAQNQAQNGSQGSGQGLGQGLSQGMGNNRSGQRDNFSGNHKGGSESAVLPSADSREGEGNGARRIASRARYA
jgi:flagellar hook-length control protein FliK